MAGEHGSAPFIGVVSDTHGYYDEQLDGLFAGALHIVHAGDVGTPDVLARLRALAPLTVVAGNTDLDLLSRIGRVDGYDEAGSHGLQLLRTGSRMTRTIAGHG